MTIYTEDITHAQTNAVCKNISEHETSARGLRAALKRFSDFANEFKGGSFTFVSPVVSRKTITQHGTRGR